jgi:hypothetical protein
MLGLKVSIGESEDSTAAGKLDGDKLEEKVGTLVSNAEEL